MSFDIINLQAFIATVETGSITQAAEQIGRTQSAVSQQISKLESLLNKNLFYRDKTMKLTQEGEIFLSYAKKVYGLHLEMLDRFKNPELEGEVSFGVPENFASVYLTEILTEFSYLHPRILLKIECDLTLNLFERFKKNEFDLVLVKMNRPEDFPNGVDILSEPLEWVAKPKFTIENSALPLILSPKPCVYRASAIKALENAGRAWRLVFSSPSFAGSLAATRAGMGITVMPHAMVPKDLVRLNSGELPLLDNTHISLLKHSKSNPAINSLEDFVFKNLKSKL